MVVRSPTDADGRRSSVRRSGHPVRRRSLARGVNVAFDPDCGSNPRDAIAAASGPDPPYGVVMNRDETNPVSDEPPFPPADSFDAADFWAYNEEPSGADTASGAEPGAVRAGSVSHRRNIATTGGFVLHDGPRVRVAGKTTLVYDLERKPHGVTLQLARLERTKGFPEWQPLPAKIHLTGPEVEDLYSRLAEARSAIQELSDTDYIVVRTGVDPNLQGLAKLIERVAQQPEQYRPLVKLVGSAQLEALRAVVNLGRFTAGRDELLAMVQTNPSEAEFQRWFEANDWVFGAEYVRRLQLPRRVSPDSQTDMMFLAVDGFADIFELKRPGAPVFVKPPGRNFYQPSPDLNAAFGQAVHYLAEADSMTLFNTVRRDMPMYRPRVRLVIGRSDTWTDDVLRYFRDVSTAWSRIELLTYDMVLRRIGLLIETMSRELNSRDEADPAEEQAR
jgi:antiviral defense system Shedu protein SduA